MNTANQNIINNVSAAITWSAQKYFDPAFQGVTLAETAASGLDSTVAAYESFFAKVQELDTANLPSEETILSLFNGSLALISEDSFITGKNGVVQADSQILTAKQLIQSLKNKKVYIITK